MTYNATKRTGSFIIIEALRRKCRESLTLHLPNFMYLVWSSIKYTLRRRRWNSYNYEDDVKAKYYLATSIKLSVVENSFCRLTLLKCVYAKIHLFFCNIFIVFLILQRINKVKWKQLNNTYPKKRKRNIKIKVKIWDQNSKISKSKLNTITIKLNNVKIKKLGLQNQFERLKGCYELNANRGAI